MGSRESHNSHVLTRYSIWMLERHKHVANNNNNNNNQHTRVAMLVCMKEMVGINILIYNIVLHRLWSLVSHEIMSLPLF